MTTLAIVSEGISFKRGDGASPEVFALIAEITDFDGPGGSATVINASHLQSIFIDKLMGLPDEGQFSFNANFVGGDVAQVGLRTDRAAKTLRNFELTLVDSPPTVVTFAGFVLEWALSAAVDDKVNLAIVIEISGQAAFA